MADEDKKTEQTSTQSKTAESKPRPVVTTKKVSPPKEEVPTGVGGSFRIDKDGVRHRVKESTQGG